MCTCAGKNIQAPNLLLLGWQMFPVLLFGSTLGMLVGWILQMLQNCLGSHCAQLSEMQKHLVERHLHHVFAAKVIFREMRDHPI